MSPDSCAKRTRICSPTRISKVARANLRMLRPEWTCGLPIASHKAGGNRLFQISICSCQFIIHPFRMSIVITVASSEQSAWAFNRASSISSCLSMCRCGLHEAVFVQCQPVRSDDDCVVILQGKRHPVDARPACAHHPNYCTNLLGLSDVSKAWAFRYRLMSLCIFCRCSSVGTCR